MRSLFVKREEAPPTESRSEKTMDSNISRDAEELSRRVLADSIG